MTLDTNIRDAGTGLAATVDSNNNLSVNLPTNPDQAGFTRIVGREDEKLRITGTGYVLASVENMEFIDTVEGAAVDSRKWQQFASTMTITQASGSLNLNPTNSTTANAYAIISSVQQFTNANTNPLYLRWSANASAFNLPPNTVMEMGWGSVSTNATPTDGVFLRFVNGTANLVINNNGTESLTAFSLPTANETSEYFMYIYGTRVKFYKDNVRILDVAASTSLQAITNSNRNPVFLRVYNTSSAPASSPTLKLGQLTVQNLNAPFNKSHSHRLVGMGHTSLQSPVTPFAQTSNNSNSAAATSATLSNTAAGYSTLGGQFQFTAVAGSETDYALFAYQVPAGLQLYVDSIDIQSFVTGAAIATTATALQWSVGVNSSAVSLATADAFATNAYAPRRKSIGVQSFAIGTAVGNVSNEISRDFVTPLVVEGGRYLHIILKIPVGTATASQVIRGTVGINGYFE